MLTIDELLLQIAILTEIRVCIKMRYFYGKFAKNCLELEVSPPDPLAFDVWVLRPKTSNLPLKIPGYTTAPHHSDSSYC